MANFIIAYNNTGGHEGGWTVDNGGQTYQGISRKGWPTWEGWRLIDAWIRKNGMPRRGMYFSQPEINNLVPVFYKKNYWDKIAGDRLQNQTIANFLYDFYVNTNSALVQVNKALGNRASSTINDESVKVMNERPGFAYMTMYNLRKAHIERLAANKALAKYKRGWMARLNSFPSQLKDAVAGIGAITQKQMMQIVQQQLPDEKERRELVSVYAKIIQMLERLHSQFSDATLYIFNDRFEVTYNNGMGRAKINADLNANDKKALNILLLNSFKGKVVDYGASAAPIVNITTVKKAGQPEPAAVPTNKPVKIYTPANFFNAQQIDKITRIVAQHPDAALVKERGKFYLYYQRKNRIEFTANNDRARRQLYNIFMDAKIKYA